MNKEAMRILSGIQPSGALHIGNYLGALKHFVDLQEDHDVFYCIVDLHALTNLPDPEELRQRVHQTAVDFLAIGLDPQKATIFVQSHVPAHSELMWLLTTMTPIGELERMTQYKDKAKEAKKKDFINAGLLNYPILMAADILAYKPEAVPVGEDQKQHLELTRNIAERINGRFGETFPVPEPLIPKTGARIMSIKDPKKKMSKSHGEDTVIGIFDEPEVIVKKLKRAVTDSQKTIKYDPKKRPGLANLIDMYALFSDKRPADVVKAFSGKGYGDLKQAVADALIEGLRSVRERRDMLMQSPAHVTAVLEQGAKRANAVASDTLRDVQRRMGLR